VPSKTNKGTSSRLEITAPKKRLFLAFTIAFPFIVLLLLEAGLRLFHYGPNLELFMNEEISGKTYLRMNPEVKLRYFISTPFSPTTSPDLFQMPKPAGTFRIFCLGGSTTVGYPYWYNGSFSTFLRDRLRAIFPEKQIEVINMGMTATNSFTVNDMARELVDYEPNLFVVYDGHNEFYGALGIASHESLGQLRWLSKLYLRLIHVRTFLLVRDIVARISGIFEHPAPVQPGATMMEKLARGKYIPYRTELYNSALKIFRENLEELKSLASERSIPVILGTQVSNLRDMPPFIATLPEDKKKSSVIDSLYLTGIKLLLMQSNVDSAFRYFKKANAMDSMRADVHYRIAQCLDSLRKKREARTEYIKARDLDMLRFRTSSEFNEAIRSACNNESILLADIEQTFQDVSPDSLIGSNLIVEHLHPNSRGFFLMAKEFARQMHLHGLLASNDEWSHNDTISDGIFWEQRSLTELDERIARRRTEILTSGWPFREGVPEVDAVTATDTLGQFAESVTRAQWDWHQAHRAAVDYYVSRKEIDNVELEYRVLINQIPYEALYYRKLAKILLDKGNLEQVRRLLLKSLEYEKTILAYRALGDIALRNGKPDEAIRYYENTFTFPQSTMEQVENSYLLSVAYTRAGKTSEAKNKLLALLKIRPDYQPAIQLLQELRRKE
jgi:tetratricopeptide (TPR) repeat protein